jgi:hypothetical protein
MEDRTALIVVEQPALPAELTATLELAADFAKASKAKATQEAYGSDFRIFDSWCRARGLVSLPATPESLCAFLADEASARRRASTLGRRLAATQRHARMRWPPSRRAGAAYEKERRVPSSICRASSVSGQVDDAGTPAKSRALLKGPACFNLTALFRYEFFTC